MKRKRPGLEGLGALDLIEEAVHLLRRASVGTFLAYYLGALPFVLGFLYFWADMSQSAFAEERCATGALGTALLFLWMKTWQVRFAERLHAQRLDRPVEPWGLAKFFRVLSAQAFLQPLGFLLIPFAALILVPFAWVLAFFQNATALGSRCETVRELIEKSAKQTQFCVRQNHLVQVILFGFGLFVFLNIALTMAQLPALLKTLFGVETIFSSGGLSLLNSTFFAIAGALTFLCVDPVIKATFVLRCFYGQSLQTGEDLRSELKSLRLPIPVSTLAILLFCLAMQTHAAEPIERETMPAPSGPAAEKLLPATELDAHIQEVIAQREYSWRSPREETPREESRSWFHRFIDACAKFMFEALKQIGRVAAKIADWLVQWLQKLFGGRTISGGGWDFRATLKLLLFLLLAVSITLIAVWIWKMWKRRQKPEEVVNASPVVPDLRQEEVLADQLPEEGWMRLARDLMDRGELRLALRAIYLASLAHLGQKEFIRIARHKSNRDYELELRRRAHALPALHAAFSENVGTFDRVWYGMHEVTLELLHEFQHNHQKLSAC